MDLSFYLIIIIGQVAFLQKQETLIGFFIACNEDFGLWPSRIIQKNSCIIIFLYRELSEKVLSFTPFVIFGIFFLGFFFYMIFFLLSWLSSLSLESFMILFRSWFACVFIKPGFYFLFCCCCGIRMILSLYCVCKWIIRIYHCFLTIIIIVMLGWAISTVSLLSLDCTQLNWIEFIDMLIPLFIMLL